MKIIKSIGFLIFLGLTLLGCATEKPPQMVTVEVTRVIERTVIVTPQPSPTEPEIVSQGISLSIPRTLHTATQLNDGRILLVGGSDGMNRQYSLVEVFDPRNDLLTELAPLHTPRHDHSAVLLKDNRVLVVGGYNSQQQWIGDAEIYDPFTDTWKITPPLFPHGVQHTATVLKDGRVLVVGGCIGAGICTEKVEVFDPQNDTWTEAKNLSAYRASHSAMLLDDGRVLIAGGGGPNGNPSDGNALIYDPITDSWTPTGSMVWLGSQSKIVKLDDSRVLVVGGITNTNHPTVSPSTQIYDPVTNSWSSAAPMSQPRYAFILATSPEGKVIAVGGALEYDFPANFSDGQPWDAQSFVLEIESYDPSNDRWKIIGKIPKPVTYGAAARLPDGRLWLTGGGAGQALSPAWAETWKISP